MATVAAQRTAIETALTAASIKNTSNPSLFTGLERMVIVFGNGGDNLGGLGFKTWIFRLVCAVPMDARSGGTALTTLTSSVLTVVQSLAGCQLDSVGAESVGIVEDGTRYLGCDVLIQMVVTI